MRHAKRAGYIFVGPATLLLLLYALVPLLWTLYYAVYRFSPNPSVPPEFTGIGNFLDLWADPQFRGALLNTLLLGLIGIPLQLLLGFLAALGLSALDHSRWFGLLFAAVMLPIAVAPIVAGIAWWLLFNTRFGAVNGILLRLGAPLIDWTVSMPWALLTIVVAFVWFGTPVAAVLLYSGLTSIPRTLVEAARVDGATGLQLVRAIILPLLQPFFGLSGIFLLTELLRLYELPFYLTQGGPGNSTVVLGIYLFKLAFNFFDLGRSAALALLYVILLSLVAIGYVRLLARTAQETA
ncbi:carbohydrate ABC transporter permease [Thermomicrobium roseum]|uniref:Possible multiple sugar transport system permease protein n=1 Tax=Thermomicrobium roseum (strain ATCC 27502 / DSM 5159 / P-2) TaxID=309801 RepID=B9KXE9_THERP|nr:sugar ABC transporter permease [Thermomicrobium roseum]ACM06231.1 possible multiple sugar transport system permease protein [Thermomicrobium roseum DSM 5159]